jgi:glycosyltransferase involved in cell wall biosynthesis
MKILLTLPTEHPSIHSLDEVIMGRIACSGTIGSIVRLADFLMSAGMKVVISGASESQSNRLAYIQHSEVDVNDFDRLIIHQSHWDCKNFTFGNSCLQKAILYLHNQTTWTFFSSFLQAGGYRIVCPTVYMANLYRALLGWSEKIAIIGNSYCPIFTPIDESESPQKRLLFVGAVTPSKGFNELMKIWAYLVMQGVDLQFAIAGGISLHSESARTGSLGISDDKYEEDCIQPWYKSLPEKSRPKFLGPLCPVDLQKEIVQSWAVIVNPTWRSPETFGVSAVDAQACNRTVFSVMSGGLQETVYQGKFHSLTTSRSPEAVGKMILHGLQNIEVVMENGMLAGNFVRSQFSASSISAAWIDLLVGKVVQPQSIRNWTTPEVAIKDLMRWSGTGMAFKSVYGKLRSRPV